MLLEIFSIITQSISLAFYAWLAFGGFILFAILFSFIVFKKLNV